MNFSTDALSVTIYSDKKRAFEDSVMDFMKRGYILRDAKPFYQFPKFWKKIYVASLEPSRYLLKEFLDRAVQNQDYNAAAQLQKRLEQ